MANTIIKFKCTPVLNFSEIHFCQEIPFKYILAHIIKENIGILHLDVEGMEKDVLIGASNTIIKNKPYILIKNNYKSGKDINENSKNNKYFLEFLPKGYKYIYNKNENNILIND